MSTRKPNPNCSGKTVSIGELANSETPGVFASSPAVRSRNGCPSKSTSGDGAKSNDNRAQTVHRPVARNGTTRRRNRLSLKHIRGFVDGIFGEDMHAARVRSLGNAVAGLVHAAVLAIHAVGHAYAQLAGIHGKSGITQIDRLLSNQKLVLDDVQRQWVEFIVQGRSDIMLAMDWTEFEKDKFSTLAVCATNNHGRATPLAWRTYPKSELKDNMRRFECEMVERLKNWLAPSARVTLLADRGFGDRKLYEFLMRVGWDFVIRFKSNI